MRFIQRRPALISQSCLAAPSCGRMISGGSGSAAGWPGATMNAPRKARQVSVLPLERLLVRQLLHPRLQELKYSEPSMATKRAVAGAAVAPQGAAPVEP